MDPTPIRPSAVDIERRRLEATVDQDLHSLSLSSLLSTNLSTTSQSNQTLRPEPKQLNPNRRNHQTPNRISSNNNVNQNNMIDQSFSSISSLEYPRAEVTPYPESYHHNNNNYDFSDIYNLGPSGTPRAAARKVSAMSERSIAESPVSTAGHHVSAITLGDGVFRRPIGKATGKENDNGEESEFDPERSFGRLVGELGKVMGGRISPRPTSPFSPPRSPRSPSPFSSIHRDLNLSFTLNRADPLPSPPPSRSGSGSSEGAKSTMNTNRPGFSAIARELADDLKKNQKKVLGESNRHNIYQQSPAISGQQGRKNLANGRDRIRAIQDESRRPHSAPARSNGIDISADVTGMTGLMETPAKGGAFGGLDKNGDVGGDAGGHSLATLHARLRALETENSLSRRRVRELELELEKAREEVDVAKAGGEKRLREAIGEKSALEDLVASLRAHLARLTIELEQNKTLVSELRLAQAHSPAPPSPPRNKSVTEELSSLRKEVERLGNEVHRLGGIVEQGLETRRKARGEETIRYDRPGVVDEGDLIGLTDEDVQRAQRDAEKSAAVMKTKQAVNQIQNQQPSKLRQGLHQAASSAPTLQPPSAGPPTRIALPPSPPPDSDDPPTSPTPTRSSESSSRRSKSKSSRRVIQRIEGSSSPFPSIRAEDEQEFFETAGITRPGKRDQSPWAKKFTNAPVTNGPRVVSSSSQGSSASKISQATMMASELPPQTVLTRVIRELEADFKHYKAIYSELAEQYKLLDAASAVAKRHVLAEHLKEVIDTLEQKADQISSLYDLLTFSDRPLSPDAGSQTRDDVRVKKTVLDILRMVRESLGEEGMKRLEEDGVMPRGGWGRA